MRKTFHRFFEKYADKDTYFLHCDMWPFETKGNVINCGIQEPNMVNIAAGLASQGKKVIIYGVAGFVLYKAYEQIKLNIKGFADVRGSIVFINAGHNGCYSFAGRGHCVDDDLDLCNAAGITLIEPDTRKRMLREIQKSLSKPGSTFIRLGWDNEKWK